MSVIYCQSFGRRADVVLYYDSRRSSETCATSRVGFVCVYIFRRATRTHCVSLFWMQCGGVYRKYGKLLKNYLLYIINCCLSLCSLYLYTCAHLDLQYRYLSVE